MNYLFKDVEFGYADATKELVKCPQIFDNAFYDPENIVESLINGDKFILSGKKGSRKTAYCSKIQRMGQYDKSIIVRKSFLGDFDYSSFTQFSDGTVKGGKKYLNIWKYLLLIEFMKMIDENEYPIENPLYIKIHDTLMQYGILSNDDMVHTIKHIESHGINLKIKDWVDLGGFSNQKELSINSAYEISEIVLKILKQLYFADAKFILFIDGLDDSLREDAFYSDEITGIIRAANVLNDEFENSSLVYRIVILIRDDILDLCRDPDLTKIRRDSEANLSWNTNHSRPYDSGLSEIVSDRIKLTYPNIKFEFIWKSMFPYKYRDESSFVFVLENTLDRPRDLLAFFIECKRAYPQLSRFGYKEFNDVLSYYSINYFVPSMQDELTGFWPDKIVTSLPTALSRVGNRTFNLKTFEIITKEMPEFSNIVLKQLLECLFNYGYIGQFRTRPEYKNNPHVNGKYVAFKYRNRREVFDENDLCYIHRGLIRGLNL